MTKFTLRPYQASGVEAGLEHFRSGRGNGVIVAPTGSGKSLYVAGMADKLPGSVLVFQPSKEILEQNFFKMRAFGHLPAIFSASAGKKQIAHITFATIGSAINRPELFKGFEHVIIDECHLADSKFKTARDSDDQSMYVKFLRQMGNPKLVGLTATPWKLGTNSFGAQNKFLTRVKGGLWNEVIHLTQVKTLLDQGYLAKTEYFYHRGIDPAQLVINSSGSDYTDASVRAAFKQHDFEAKVLNMVERLLKHGRKSILVFTRFVEEAARIAQFMPDIAAVVSGETPKAERERILSDYKAGRIKVVANVGVLTVGFDFPELDTVILARPTMSMSLYYQMMGRVLRPHPSKTTAYVLDMVGVTKMFGPVEDFHITKDYKGLWCVKSGNKQLTNVVLNKPAKRQFAW